MVETPVTSALPNSRFSLRSMLIISYLKTVMRMPKRSIVKLLDKLYGLKLSNGEIMGIIDQLSHKLGAEYDKLVKAMRVSKSRNIDETTWRIDGKNAWLWTFVTKGEAIYKISYSRGHKVAESVLKMHERYT